MIVNKLLANELFRAFHIQRWNDRVRPMELTEMDKHAHKMIIAWCLAKYEEDNGFDVDWTEIVKGGIYELVRRIVISDIKSPIFAEIRKNKEVFAKLNSFIFSQIEPIIENSQIKSELFEHICGEQKENINTRILSAAHIYASWWEFQIIKQSNPFGYQNTKIESELLNEIKAYSDLTGIRKLTERHTIANFVDLCGQLRFQIRWAQTPRVPKTSVLGHLMFVATIAYFFSRELNPCPKRLYNTFFGGLFHDLPEAATRDIISPVKNSSDELDRLIKDLERELAEQEIFPLVEHFMIQELKYFAQDEFSNKALVDNTIITGIAFDELNNKYNSNQFNPYDGELIRAADHFAAFSEAWHSCSSGIISEDLLSSARNLKSQYSKLTLGNVSVCELFDSYTLTLGDRNDLS